MVVVSGGVVVVWCSCVCRSGVVVMMVGCGCSSGYDGDVLCCNVVSLWCSGESD